jgi:predicted enzyme related to lactoylglutathione lyase
MACCHGRFVWYELLTTDTAAARAFYAAVVGWGAQDASTPDLAYGLFTLGSVPLGGLMELPEEARKMGATPRWLGYVDVDDVDAAADRVRRLGGAVLVAPTDSNIGRISIVADPQRATLALVGGLSPGLWRSGDLAGPGRVGWNELLAADSGPAFHFYGELFGWQKTDAEIGATDRYLSFAAGGQTIGGMFTKAPAEPAPFWHYYFNVEDLDLAIARVKAGGGAVFEGPLEAPGNSWIVRCIDPQRAIFALQGKRSPENVRRASGSEVAWSTEWSGISSRGRLITKPRG